MNITSNQETSCRWVEEVLTHKDTAMKGIRIVLGCSRDRKRIWRCPKDSIRMPALAIYGKISLAFCVDPNYVAL